MTDEIRKQIEQEAFLNIQKFIRNTGEIFFNISKDENDCYTLENQNLNYRLEKNNRNKYDKTYGLVIIKNDKEIKFPERPISNSGPYDELVILLQQYL